MALSDEQQRILNLVHHWCPEFSLKNEDFDTQVARAFLAATACAADQHRALTGVPPIRPLHSYPDPMKFFGNTPTGEASNVGVKKSSTPRIDELRVLNNRLKYLLDDPQTGLPSWVEMYGATMTAINKFWEGKE